MLRGNLAADLVFNRRSRSAATRRFSFEPIRLASLPLADLGCESGICLVGAKTSCHSALAHGRKANALGLQGNLLRQNPCSLTLLAEAIFILLRQFACDPQSSLA
ncbi:hypothetical protein [uncultured Slackia sp.]|uniref:hypothetical protein n=1 Tax=uncultured Slackia sp. TaxID=665903 RepID=UPI0025903384|nr:hypothetical protein [uncultured Slackia sp.]